jgi:hypothetical protein
MESTNQPLEDLREIRNLMERSTRFLSLSGLAGISAGISALLGAAVAFFLLDYDQRYFEPGSSFSGGGIRFSGFISALILDGAIVLLVALIMSFYFTQKKAKKSGLPVWDIPTRRMLTALSFPLAAGGILCLILLFQNLVYLISPITLIFYGIALISASHFTLPELKYLGISELVLGLIAAVFTRYGLIFWAMGFGLLHIIYGFRMYLKYER